MSRPWYQGAHQKVARALRSGALVKGTRCEDCSVTEALGATLLAHHEDYSRPLEVVWLCRSCHFKRHEEREPERFQTMLIVSKKRARRR